MKTLTVRGIEPKRSELLKNLAKQEGKSVNQVIIDTLKKHFGLQKEKNIRGHIMIWTIFLVAGLKMIFSLVSDALIQRPLKSANFGIIIGCREILM